MPSPAPPPPVRVIIRLPYNRPHEGYDNPPQIEWTPKKESILWEVIAKSRASDSGGTDWQGLALHLEVPLPYLLFRAQTRYEEDLKGIQHLQGPFAPTAGPPSARAVDEDGKGQDQVGLARKTSSRAAASSTKLPASGRLNTPLGIRARLNSLGYDSGSRQSKTSSSSVLTLQGPRPPPIRTSTSSLPYTDSNSESEEEAEKAEEEERRLEEQEALDKKLKHLQSIMTSNTLGLVKEAQPKKKGKEIQRGRDVRSPTSPSPLRQTFAGSFRRDLSSSDLNSNTSSPQGSIPSIPSPPPENESRSPVARHFQHTKSSSPPAVSRVQAHVPYRPMTVGLVHTSDRSSTQGSSASSFTDISDMSLSTEALENALQSNLPGTGSHSRMSAFRSQFVRRTSRGPGNASLD